jgi:hypothetical protein
VAAQTSARRGSTTGRDTTSPAPDVRSVTSNHENEGNGGVESERTGQSSSGLDERRSWYHLKRCKWVLGSTSTMPRRPTDGCQSAGAAALRLMVRKGFTSRTNDNWNVSCDGLMHSR